MITSLCWAEKFRGLPTITVELTREELLSLAASRHKSEICHLDAGPNVYVCTGCGAKHKDNRRIKHALGCDYLIHPMAVSQLLRQAEDGVRKE